MHGVLDYTKGHTPTWSSLVMWSAIVGFLTGTWFTHAFLGGLIAGVVASVLVLAVTRLDHWRKYRKSWYTEYEPRRDETFKNINIEHIDGTQRVPLRLRFKAPVHVTSIMFDLTGGTNVPKLLGLYDWNIVEDLQHSANVFTEPNARGAWYWHYHNGLLRTPGPKGLQNTIAVGLEVETRGACRGQLIIQLAYEERTRMPKYERIPFNVQTTRQ